MTAALIRVAARNLIELAALALFLAMVFVYADNFAAEMQTTRIQ